MSNISDIFTVPQFTVKKPDSVYFWGSVILTLVFFTLGFIYNDMSTVEHIKRAVKLTMNIVFYFIIAFIIQLMYKSSSKFMNIFSWILSVLLIAGHSFDVFY